MSGDPVQCSGEVERALLSRSRRRIAAQIALIVTGLVTLVGGIAYVVLIHGQHQQVQRELRYAAERGDPGQQTGCVWTFLLTGGVLNGPPGAPPGLPLPEPLRRVGSSGRATQTTVHRNGAVYVVRTQPRGDAVVQVAIDDRYLRADRRQLLIALALAEAVGLLAALGTGALVGRRTIAPLAEALDRQRRFVTNASHELRTPIAQVHTRAQLLVRQARDGALPPQHRTELDRLVGTTRRLGEIVDELLLSARLSAAPPVARPVDLAAVTAAAVLAESPRAHDRDVALDLEHSGDPLPIDGVESALRRVVASLLDNAIGHTPPGGRIVVSLHRDAAAGTAELTIADTGAGFDPADADRIFDRFYRGPGGGGRRFGLGLALVAEVVTSHRGTIEAMGEPGRGARFTVRLPSARRPVT